MSDPKRIVLVDPTADITTGLAERLRMQGYEVIFAKHPAEGARLALLDPPAAVVADLWMPSISGVQLCRLLKTEPATEGVPVILRGPDSPRDRFWSERAGAAAYVVRGRMGDLVRALTRVIVEGPATDGFFTSFSGDSDIHERIAAGLDKALFESVLAAEVRALGTCGEFGRLFDLFSQFVARIGSYRWLAVSTTQPVRFGLHASPKSSTRALAEARAVLGIAGELAPTLVEDDDAFDDERGPPPIAMPIELGGMRLGELALAPREGDDGLSESLVAVIARELAGPIRMATLVEESQRLARIDALTGLMNRRAFSPMLHTEIARAERHAVPLSLLLLDVDRFKVINDTRGHGAGDLVLASLGRLLGTGRSSDMVARWGGEEFVVALSHTDEAAGQIFAERLRHAIETMVVPDPVAGNDIPVTASIGLARFEPGDSLETLVDKADRAMYAAKCGGRNRVMLASASEPAQKPSAPSTELVLVS